MVTLDAAQQLLKDGFSLMPVRANKIPAAGWTELRETPHTPETFELACADLRAVYYGILTGYKDLECVDVDLKVLDTQIERVEFWKDLTDFLDDNIEDFYSKVVIYKTRNNGFHILYKCANIEGNKKIATLKDHKQAIIETRGIGGYVFCYVRVFARHDIFRYWLHINRRAPSYNGHLQVLQLRP